MKKTFLQTLMLVCFAASVNAQEAPAPHKAPRTPVNRETLATRATVARDVQGQAMILDGEKLRVGDADVRLFGVVPPQLSASFGPQARAALDSLTANQMVACHVRDRDHDGRLLATCRNASGADLALELLRRGLAVTARGSIADTELSESYLAAEQSAQNQKLGLWSVNVSQGGATVPAPVVATQAAPQIQPKEALLLPPVASEEKIPESKKDETRKEDVNTKSVPTKIVEKITPVVPALISVPVHEMTPVVDRSESPGFFARYQILIAGILMLLTALGVLSVFVGQRFVERREEMKALAAALRGELLAARAVCQTRLRAIVSDEDDRNVIWPRLRATLYQAYVGRLGWLGAELARQIASIYGQSSDYAAYYNVTDDTRAATTPKRQALQLLINHIDEVLPRLATIEQTGRRLKIGGAQQSAMRVPVKLSPTLPNKPLLSHHSDGGTDGSDYSREPAAPQSPEGDPFTTAQIHAGSAIVLDSASPEATLPSLPASPSQTSSAVLSQATQAVVQTPGILWDTLRRFAREHFSQRGDRADDDTLPDYATLIEQDIAHMSFGDVDDDTSPLNDVRKTGAL